jgi:alcohol dehydrogenase (cytochrome c)
MDSRSGKVLWRHRNRLAYDTAALTTAGGLVFVGDFDRYFYAYDASTGNLLWRTRTPSPPDGFPISYAVRGRQYVAVPSGPGWFNSYQYDIKERIPGFHRVLGSSTIHVFALPETAKVSPTSRH